MNKEVFKIAFIINPKSGINSKNSFPELIEKNLDKNIYLPEILFTERAGHATEIAAGLVQKGYKYIVAVGGDGTVNETAQSLVHKETALGIIPAGSGNGLARHLGIPLDPVRAIRLLNEKYSIRMDTAALNDLPFFCTAGVGFDAFIGEKFSKQKTRGFRTYVRTTFQAFFSYKAKYYWIKAPFGELQTNAFLITVGNTSQYGNNAFICPYADVQDGLLDVSIIKPFPKIFALDMGRRLFNRSILQSRYTTSFTASEFEIKRSEEGPVHIDGEPMVMGKELRLKIIPKSLNVLVHNS